MTNPMEKLRLWDFAVPFVGRFFSGNDTATKASLVIPTAGPRPWEER